AIRANESDNDSLVLHAYWDARVFNDEPNGFKTVIAIADKWTRGDAAFKRDQLPELAATDVAAWAEESLELAKSVYYKGDGRFLMVDRIPKSANVEFGRVVDFKAPIMPVGYDANADKVAARRMVLAGYRSADQLQLVFADKN